MHKNICLFHRYRSEHDDYSIIMVKALADRLAEVHLYYIFMHVQV